MTKRSSFALALCGALLAFACIYEKMSEIEDMATAAHSTAIELEDRVSDVETTQSDLEDTQSDHDDRITELESSAPTCYGGYCYQ